MFPGALDKSPQFFVTMGLRQCACILLNSHTIGSIQPMSMKPADRISAVCNPTRRGPKLPFEDPRHLTRNNPPGARCTAVAHHSTGAATSTTCKSLQYDTLGLRRSYSGRGPAWQRSTASCGPCKRPLGTMQAVSGLHLRSCL